MGVVRRLRNEIQLFQFFLVKCAIKIIGIYQNAVSPLLGPRCRFFPSCSQYAIESFETRGLLLGSVLALSRILRCHPWSRGGVDELSNKNKRKGIE